MKTRRYLLLLPLLLAVVLVAGCKYQSPKQKAAAYLTTEIQKANKLMAGKYVDDITLCDAVLFNGKDVVYNFTYDEVRAQMTIRDFTETPQKDALDINLQLTWATNPSMAALKKLVKTLGGMIIYNYTGSLTGEGFTITIDPED